MYSERLSKRIGSDFMKIIKQGNLNIARKPLRFECKNCGTIFEAIKQEYIYCGDQREGDNWKCECPLCRGAVYYN
jgi:Zn finger protein HypA/HybF involved in hydrogenase expression